MFKHDEQKRLHCHEVLIVYAGTHPSKKVKSAGLLAEPGAL